MKLIHERRRCLGTEGAPASPGAVGLALSGGGIRSATICLGILQALAQVGLLKRFDYLSTVSGGGYIGGFLGALYLPRREPQKSATGADGRTPADVVTESLRSSDSKEIGWLRENGRYLAPAGAPDEWAAAAAVARSLFAIYIVLGVSVLTGFLLTHALRRGAFEILSRAVEGIWFGSAVAEGVYASPWFLLWGAAVVLWAIPAGLAFWALPNETREDGRGRALVPPAMTLLLCTAGTIAAARTLSSAGEDWTGETRVASLMSLSGVVGLAFLLASRILTRWRATRAAASGSPSPKGAVEQARAEDSIAALAARNLTTRWLAIALKICTVLFVFASVDSGAETLYVHLEGDPTWIAGLGTSITAGLVAVGTALQKALGFLGPRMFKARVRVPYQLLALVLAIAVSLTVLTSIDTVAHGLVHGWKHATNPVFAGGFYGSVSMSWLAWSLGAGGFFAWFLGQTFPFLNRSALSSLYAARLARAYVGASNPDRHQGGNRDITELLPGDIVRDGDYRPHLAGGPLHIINSTLNETVDGKSQLEMRDRHGMNLAIGPAGLSLAARHHALWSSAPKSSEGWPVPGSELILRKPPPSGGTRDTGRAKPSEGTGEAKESKPSEGTENAEKAGPSEGTGNAEKAKPSESHDALASATGVRTPESLHLGQWMATSGAAVSTGLGSRTSVGLSLVLGLLNVRLGRWWDSGAKPILGKNIWHSPRALLGFVFAQVFPVQAHLFEEILARFHGPARRFWYLTDGGHFENTAAYELIRRRVPIIVVCDNGADANQDFTDLGGLVRKARIDFGAEIRFVDRLELDALRSLTSDRGFGSLEELGLRRRDEGAPLPESEAIAAVARVTYAGGKDVSSLILFRPRIRADFPVDVLSYKRQAPAFPQQSTADQFFDEAQWESYRRLGYGMGMRVFGGGETIAPRAADPGSPASESWLFQLHQGLSVARPGRDAATDDG